MRRTKEQLVQAKADMLKWIKDNGRLPDRGSCFEEKLWADSHNFRQYDPEFKKVTDKYRRAGRKGNGVGTSQFSDDYIIKLGLLWAENDFQGGF
jgi:hypothetical protein